MPLGYDDPDDVLNPDDSPLSWRVPQVRADPASNQWLIRIAVDRATGVIVGQVNFHAPPDDQGMVEIGSRVNPAHRGQGYATEIARTMVLRRVAPRRARAARQRAPRQRAVAPHHERAQAS